MDHNPSFGKDYDPRSREWAEERGYNNRTRTVVLDHVGHLMQEAHALRRMADRRIFPEPAPGGEVENSRDTERTLERLANLLRHAAEEVEDERLRLRDGWPA